MNQVVFLNQKNKWNMGAKTKKIIFYWISNAQKDDTIIDVVFDISECKFQRKTNLVPFEKRNKTISIQIFIRGHLMNYPTSLSYDNV